MKGSQIIKNKTLTHDDICNIVKTNLLGKLKENIFLILMNSNSELLYSGTLREGNINNIGIYVDEIVRLSIKYKAIYLVILHNHPSGNLLPSIEDIETTKKLNFPLKLINVKLKYFQIMNVAL